MSVYETTIYTIKFNSVTLNVPIGLMDSSNSIHKLTNSGVLDILRHHGYPSTLFSVIKKLNPSLVFFGNRNRLVFFKDNYKYSLLKKNPTLYADIPSELELKWSNCLCRTKQLNLYATSNQGEYINFNVIDGKRIIYDEECFIYPVFLRFENNVLKYIDIAPFAYGSCADYLMPNNFLSVLTRHGFKKFGGIQCCSQNELLKITLKNYEYLECNGSTEILTKKGFVRAKDLKVNDKVIHSMIGTQNPKPISITSIEYIVNDVNSFFDLINVEGDEFMANGFTIKALSRH